MPEQFNVILISRFEATRGLFWDGPRNFEPQSDDENDTWASNPLSKLLHPILHMLVGRLSPRWPSTGLAPFLGRPGQCGEIIEHIRGKEKDDEGEDENDTQTKKITWKEAEEGIQTFAA
ncbi:hypothetical protein AVEN_89066-1 [Araneus ventricosus]|uniref:Uncharacterized protein n=1 Tax=Araneus ventricosus TaxID=182803 RepID=A0A4Y2B3Y1_ARAVE|nr:hypothetical protein AVEN_89066-1 [Araneus ventricosus]